jgi:hypothetical protein
MSDKTRPNGLYWVFYGEDWTVAQYQYSKYNSNNENWRVIGDDVNRGDDDFEGVGELIQPQTKSITTVNGSKYNYTVQKGEVMVSLGFNTYEELRGHVRREANNQ